MKWSKSLSVKAASVSFLLAATASVHAEPVQSVRVEITAQGIAAIASHLRQGLPGKLQRALVARPIEGFPKGAQLLVRVRSVYLSSDSPMGGFGGGDDSGGVSMPDSIEGEVLILDASGRILAQKPMIAHAPVHMGGAIRYPANEPNRVNALMDSLSYWTMREF